MTAARGPHGFPVALASLCGFVVALVSASTGIAGHAMAMGAPGLSPAAIVSALAAAGLIGVATSSASNSVHPGLATVSGLVTAQLAVHQVLAWTHGAHAAGHSDHVGLGDAMHLLYSPAEHAELVRSAMDSAGAGHTAGPAMLGAHVVATVAAAGLVAVLAGLLGWLAARSGDLLSLRLPATAPATRPAAPVAAVNPTPRYLLGAPGGVRGPPRQS